MVQYGTGYGTSTRKADNGLLDPRALSAAKKLVTALAG